MSLIDPTGNPHDIAAQLLREQFADWEAMFKPIELAQLQRLSFNNPKVLTDAVATAGANANAFSDSMQGILQRQQAAQGVVPTAQEAAVSQRVLDHNRALNVVAAENTARTNVRTLDDQLLLGSAPNPNVVPGAISQQQ